MIGNNMTRKLPCDYTKLTGAERRLVREQYIVEQKGLCWHCGEPLNGEPHASITAKPINLKLFPNGFLENPIHLQHCHETDMTEGAVHAYCNAYLWQYLFR